MSPLALWLCTILLIGTGIATDVPFVFDKATSNVAGYTSTQIEQAHIFSPDLAGVPFTSTPHANDTLEFPITGGGDTPPRTTGKKADDLKKLLSSKVEADNPTVIREVGLAAGKYSGDYTIEQVSAIYDYLKENWHYLRDPRGVDYFRNATESLELGKLNKCVGVGDCDDFSILMSALVEATGGTTRIILARNNDTGGHAYSEVYLGQLNATGSQVENIINWLKQTYVTDKIYTHIDTKTKDVWLNFDWGPDEIGSFHPGGPFYPGDTHYIICIRDTYGKTPLKLPEKQNKPPMLIRLIPDKADPQEVGASITWTANAKDLDRDQILYRFFINDEPTTNWSNDNKWIWPTTEDDIGKNQIEVRIRDGKHRGPNRFDDNAITTFNVTMPTQKPTALTNQPPVSTNFISDKTSPLEAGTTVTWIPVAATEVENQPAEAIDRYEAYPPAQQTTIDGLKLSFQIGQAYDRAIQGQDVPAYNALVDSWNAWVRTNFGGDPALICQKINGPNEPINTSPQNTYTPAQQTTIDGLRMSFQIGRAYDKAMQGQDVPAWIALYDQWKAWVVKNFGNNAYPQISRRVLPDILPGV
jgi:hypothetical protein